MMRKLLAGSLICYLVLVAGLAVALLRAAPGPGDQEVRAVGIERSDSPGEAVYFSGRRLSCAPAPQESSFSTACSIDIAGETLSILAHHNNQVVAGELRDGACEAHYAEQVWPCVLGSYRGEPWAAQIQASAELTPHQLAQLRWRYPLENLPESLFFGIFVGLPLLTTLLVSSTLLAWLRPRWPQQSPARVLLTTMAGVTMFLSSGWLAFTLTRGFWD